MKNKLLVLAFILFSSCSHLPYKAPDQERLANLKAGSTNKQETSPPEKMALSYSRALSFLKGEKPQKACQVFQQLARRPRFALRSLSRLRAIQSCSLGRREMWQALKDFDSQYNVKHTDEEFLRFAVEWLDQNQGPKDLNAKYSFRLFEYQGNLEKKIKSIQKAIELTTSQKAQEKYQAKLEEIAPRFISQPKKAQVIKVARDLERARNFQKARSLYRRAINTKGPKLKDKLYALKRIGLTYKVQRSRKLYLKKLREIGTIIRDIDTTTAEEVKLKASSYIDNQITLARAIWTANEREKAQNIIMEMLKYVPQTNAEQMAHIYYILGAMELEAKNKDEALEYFKRGLEYPTSEKDIRQYLSWSWAHNLFLMQKYKKAIQAMQVSLEKTEDSPTFQAKLLFWQGMSYQKLKRPHLAEQRFSAAIELAPHSYYSIMARHQLGLPYRPLKKRAQPVTIDRVFDWLVLVNEKTAASAYIEELDEQKDLSLHKKIQAFFQAELYQEAIFAYARRSSELSESKKEKFLPLIFPSPYLDIYQKYASSYDVPYELALAITRQESAFNKDARSWADAFGLMQLIPEKAQSLSRELDLEFDDFSKLYEARYNIQLGSYLLSKLVKRYNQQFPFFIAAYNAGDRPVKNWKNGRFNGDTLEFIEMIPYSETQTYVKLILRNMVIYRQLTSTYEFDLEDIGIFIE